MKTDQELVRATQEGSIQAFEDLVKKYQNKLVVFVTRLTHDPSLADDIVIDTLFSLYKTIDRVNTSKKFSSYLYTMVRNAAYSALRQQKNHVSLAEALAVPDEAQHEYSFVDEHDRQRIQSALQKIPTRYATVLGLYYFDELSYEEIARKVRLPINTVRTHLARGKAALKKIL